MREKRVRRGAHRGETVSRLQACCIKKNSPFPETSGAVCQSSVG